MSFDRPAPPELMARKSCCTRSRARVTSGLEVRGCGDSEMIPLKAFLRQISCGRSFRSIPENDFDYAEYFHQLSPQREHWVCRTHPRKAVAALWHELRFHGYERHWTRDGLRGRHRTQPILVRRH